MGFSSLGGAEARTFPGEVTKLLALKAELENRGLGYLLDTWICPPEGEGECDPCGPTAGRGDSWGAWHYIACRQVPPGERAAAAAARLRRRRRRLAGLDGENAGDKNNITTIIDAAAYFEIPGDHDDKGGRSAGQKRLLATTESDADRSADEDPSSNVMGLVTNIHLSDLAIEGTLESMEKVLCPFRHLRELDLDGGRLVGPIPDFIGACFPHLLELDLSHNQLSGSVPADIWRGVPNLEQAKLEDNRLTGTIPSELASLGNLRVLWLDKNDLVGSVPAAFGATNALGKILSLNVEDNPSMCGDLPKDLGVDWRWQLSNQNGTSRDWFGFCVKDPCGIFAYGGTNVGKACAPDKTANGGDWWSDDDSTIAINSDDGRQPQSPSCGKLWDQCGGTVAVTIAVWPEGGYGEDTDENITIDVPFDGRQCCRRGLSCVEVERDDEEKTSFSQCVNDPNWILPELKTEVPPEILREYRELNSAVEEASCADAWQQCGGAANYLGPQCCKGAAPCVRSSEFYSQCDPATCAAAWQQCGGYRHEGPQCCREGLECVIHNGGYHQCVVTSTLDESRYKRDSKSSKLRRFEDDELPPPSGNDEETARPNTWEIRGVGDRYKVNGEAEDDEGACVPLWSQCDGFFFEPFLRGPARLPCCRSPSGDAKFDDENRNASSTKCVVKNDWFSACETCVETWEQCGGLDYAGGSCCRDDADACVKVDDFFWQCQPPDAHL